MPRRVEFTRRSWLASTIFDGIRDFADPGEWPTTKNPTPILDSARSADAGRHVGFATGARVSALTTCRRSMRLANPSAARQQKGTLPIAATTRHAPAARCRRQDNAPARQARSPRTTIRSGQTRQQQPPRLTQTRLAMPASQQPVVPNLCEPLRQHVLHEATQKLLR
jgi:hypothetical protein